MWVDSSPWLLPVRCYACLHYLLVDSVCLSVGCAYFVDLLCRSALQAFAHIPQSRVVVSLLCWSGTLMYYRSVHNCGLCF